MNREQYLTDLAQSMEAMFIEHGHALPPYRVTCGWPSRSPLAKRNRTIGQCWSPKSSGDSTTELIISMGIDDPMEVAAILAHEMVHAAVGVEHGHKKPFKQCALAIGLEGKMTATTASEAFKRRVQPMLDNLGDYPHAKLDGSSKKKDGTRMLKAICPACGYTVRLTQKWLDVATPNCPIDHIEMNT